MTTDGDCAVGVVFDDVVVVVVADCNILEIPDGSDDGVAAVAVAHT